MQKRHACRFRLFFAGSVSPAVAGGGWILYGATTLDEDALHDWDPLTNLSFEMPHQSMDIVCELEACVGDIGFVTAMNRCKRDMQKCLTEWLPLQLERVKIQQVVDLLRWSHLARRPLDDHSSVLATFIALN